MKKYLILLALLSGLVRQGVSQNIGYLDLDFVTGKMPEYKKAQEEINSFSEKWAKEIRDKFGEVDKMQRAYMAEEVLLTEELKRKRQNDIKEKELEAREYNNKVFGMQGLLFQKRKELIKPVLEKVQRAVDKIAAQKKLDFIFDKSSDNSLIYTNPRHDYTDYIMEELGIEIKPAAAPPVTAASQPATKSSPVSSKKPTVSSGEKIGKDVPDSKSSSGSTTRKPK